jgi:HAD superfamily hydrolase (TIGR01458 family)
MNQRDPNCVLLGDARERLDYASLNQAFRLCKQGGRLIGIGMNKYFKDENGLNLDAGPFIRAIEWAADTSAIIMGKPSPGFYAQVVASTPYTADQCLMVGDDVHADVDGAVKAGLQGCLVRTGKYQRGDEQKLPAGAQVIDTVAGLL